MKHEQQPGSAALPEGGHASADPSAATVEAARPARWRRYVAALLLAVLAGVLTALLRPLLSSAVFLFFYPAIVIAAWYGGVGPGALVALLGVIEADYLFVDRVGLALPTTVELLLFGMFLVVTVLVSMLAARARHAQELARVREREARALAARLREQAEELEARARELENQAIELEQAMEVAEEARAEAEDALEGAAEAERRAVEASAAKSEFLAVMSHELRTPLNAIMGYADLLDAGVGGARLDGAAAQYLERVRGSVVHLRGLIDQVLSLSRIEAGHEDVLLEEVSLAAVVEEAVEMCRPQATQKGLELVSELDGLPESVLTDASKLRQILLNLLANAVKFTDTGSVTLRAYGEEERAVIEVRDTGVGIAPEHVQRVFEPFTQVDQSRTRRGGGIGLGLPVSRRLAELLGGALVLVSTPGAGSTFILTLPQRAPAFR